MSLEVIVPALRQAETERLVASLGLGSVLPDLVTIVSNEVQPFGVSGMPTRLLRFASSVYSIGSLDVALRQNVGIFAARCTSLVISGDDQLASSGMVEATIGLLRDRDHFWGNHRIIDFAGRSTDELVRLPATAGASRETPVPPARHGYASCYGGMFGARTDFLQSFGGFDLAFNGRHGSEDQQLGYRLMRRAGEQGVWIHEPPFSWMGEPGQKTPWLKPLSNTCDGEHVWRSELISDVRFKVCERCPLRVLDDDIERLFRDIAPVIRYDPSSVTTESVWLSLPVTDLASIT